MCVSHNSDTCGMDNQTNVNSGSEKCKNPMSTVAAAVHPVDGKVCSKAIEANERDDVEAGKIICPSAHPIVTYVRYRDILVQFTILGWTAFGGPAAHIAIYERRLVQKMHWMTTDLFAELFALAQCMPGPTSSQISMSVGVIKKGVRGGLLAGFLFLYPGSFIMTLVGVFAAKKLEHPSPALNGVVSGISAVGVALVASAAKSLGRKLCSQRVLAAICTVTAVIAYSWPKPYTFPSLILGGGLTSLLWSLHTREVLPTIKAEQDESVLSHGFTMRVGASIIALWLAVLIGSIMVVNGLVHHPPQPVLWWEVFFRTGSVIFGGGQVVLPVMYSSVVKRVCDLQGLCRDSPDTWITSKQFYAGLGIVQALPGPLFNFSTYLGTILAINMGYPFIFGAVLVWCAMFFPGIMLLFGVLPFWGHFRRWDLYRRALPGFNAAGTGLVVTSVFSLTLGVLEQTTFPKTTLCLGILSFTAVDQFDWFQPLVVLLGGVMGVVAWCAGLA